MDEKKNKEDGSYEFIKETIKKKPLRQEKNVESSRSSCRSRSDFWTYSLHWFLQL